ncbi:MAG: hypothetical protein AAF441_26770 [Pseudomonadota bacterium]
MHSTPSATSLGQESWADSAAPAHPPAASDEDLALERPPLILKMNWADIVGDLTCSVGEHRIRVETAPAGAALNAAGPWMLVTGKAGHELFALLLEQRFAYLLAREHDRDLRRFPEEPGDCALLLEFCLQALLEALEASLGKPLTLDLADACQTVPAHSWLCVNAEMAGETFQIGLAPGPDGMAYLSRLAEDYADPAEKQIDSRLLVKVGPVALPAQEAITSGPGDKFDTGIDPAGDVRGILERSDGKFWPVLIDDDEVTITGDLHEPVSLPDQAGQILVGFEIGDLELGAQARRALQTDSRVPVNRIPGNGVIIWLNRGTHGSGHLDMIDDSLAVTIDASGAN